MKPTPPDLAEAAQAILEENSRRAAHLGARDVLHIVDEIARIPSLIEASRTARQFVDRESAERLLDKARAAALELLGIATPGPSEKRSRTIEFSQLVEVYWPFDGDVRDPDWTFCKAEATFSHQEACEFIFHLAGDNERQDWHRVPEYAHETIKRMQTHGCSAAFVKAYTQIAKTGATRVLFWC